MSKKHWTEKLAQYEPCDHGLRWAKEQPSLAVAWQKCRRGDWMLWLLSQTLERAGSLEHRRLVLAVCACTRLCPLAPLEVRIIDEVVERWACGLVSTAEIRHVEADLVSAHNEGAMVALSYVTAPRVGMPPVRDSWRSALCSMARIVRTHFPTPPELRA
jgi:hypothetical protein